MRNPFFRSAGPVFVDREAMLAIAGEAARRLAAGDPNVLKAILFGSFARNDYGPRSDLDLLIVLRHSDKPHRDRVMNYLRDAPPYPTDMFAYTAAEIEAGLAAEDPFICRAMREGVQLFPESA